MGNGFELPGAVVSLADDILAAFATAFRADRATVCARDEDGLRRRVLASIGLTDAERERVESWSRDDAGRYWARLPPRPLHRVASDPDPSGPWHGIVEAAPHLTVPLIGRAGRPVGVVLVAMPNVDREDLGVAARLARVAAVAIENTHVAERREVELARTAVLLDVVREVDRPAELPDVLAAICRKTVEGFRSRQATVFFRSRRHRASLPLADYGTPPHVAAYFVGGRYIQGNIPHEDEVRSGRTVVITRATQAPEDVALLDVVEVSTLVMVPLRDEAGAVHGMLTVGFDRPHVPDDAELKALEMVARHATMAIIRARLLHWTAQSARFRAAVSALAAEINAATGRSETLVTLCRRGCELFEVESGALLLESDRRLVPAAAWGSLATADEVVIDGSEAPVLRALRERTVVLEKDRPRRDEGATLDRLRSLLVIPLLERGRTIGVLVFGALRPRRFRPNVVAEAPLLGALAVGVLKNLELTGELQEKNQRLAQLSIVKDQFLANVSHDLRTPLNVIIGFAQLALEDTFGEPTAELRATIARMLASAEQQLALVRDLLDVSRLELNGLHVRSTAMALSPLLTDMEILATSLVRDKPVRVAVERPVDDPWVHADADRVRQILTNLLGNAAKFTDHGTIGLRVRTGDGTVQVDVFDTGIGIPPANLEAIFEPFRQVEGDRAVLGAGLGLAIARRLATLMGGTLTVASRVGVGSTFSLTLPPCATSASALAAAHAG